MLVELELSGGRDTRVNAVSTGPIGTLATSGVTSEITYIDRG